MKVIYQGVNPRRVKKKNPEEVTYSKGGKSRTVTGYTAEERAELIKSKKAIKDSIRNLESQKIEGSSRQINLLRKAKDKAVSALKKREGIISNEIEKLKNARADRLKMSFEGYKEKSKRVTPLRKDLTEGVNKKIVKSITRSSDKFAGDNVAKLQRSAKLHATKMAKKNELLTIQNKLKRSEDKLKELKALQKLGASEKDRTDLVFTKAEVAELKKQLVSQSKGVGMAKKKRKVAKKATAKKVAKKVSKVAKKAKRKVAKKATKRKASKKASKAKAKSKPARKRRKAKKVVAEVIAKPKRRKARKSVKAKAKKARRKSSKKSAKKSNPYVVAKRNPYVRSNPMLTKVDSMLDRALGVSTVELGGVVIASAIDGKITELTKSLIAKVGGQKVLDMVPSEYHSPIINGVLGGLLIGAEHLLSKKKIKYAGHVGDVGRGFLLVSLVKAIGQVSPISEENTLSGYVSEATPRSMGGYVLENSMAGTDVDFGGKSVDFQGVDFQGTSVDFEGVGSLHDDFDLDSTDW